VLYGLILAVHVVACLFLIMVVLLQTGKGGDIASAFGGGGGSSNVFGPRGASNVLTRATTAAAVIFMLTSLTLAILSQRGESTLIDEIVGDAVPATSESTTETIPASPMSTGTETESEAPVLPPSDGDGTSQ